jgi:predicted ArsR family transcriptional regulator
VDSKRETILAFLKTRGHATLGEIAAHLEVSKQATLRHLEGLADAGLATVSPSEVRRPGRPENVYKLTAAAGEHFPDGHRELTGELVDFISTEQLKAFFEKRAARLEAEYAAQLAGQLRFARMRMHVAHRVHEFFHMVLSGFYDLRIRVTGGRDAKRGG